MRNMNGQAYPGESQENYTFSILKGNSCTQRGHNMKRHELIFLSYNSNYFRTKQLKVLGSDVLT